MHLFSIDKGDVAEPNSPSRKFASIVDQGEVE
jgi:hypothetical protein